MYAGICTLGKEKEFMKIDIRAIFFPLIKAVSFGVVLFPPAVIAFFF